MQYFLLYKILVKNFNEAKLGGFRDSMEDAKIKKNSVSDGISTDDEIARSKLLRKTCYNKNIALKVK